MQCFEQFVNLHIWISAGLSSLYYPFNFILYMPNVIISYASCYISLQIIWFIACVQFYLIEWWIINIILNKEHRMHLFSSFCGLPPPFKRYHRRRRIIQGYRGLPRFTPSAFADDPPYYTILYSIKTRKAAVSIWIRARRQSKCKAICHILNLAIRTE